VAAKSSRRFVVDASIARAAGDADATDLKSTQCRDTLTSVLIVCHRMVLTPAVGAEWKKHRSKFARRWQKIMESRRKILYWDDTPLEQLRDQLREQTKNEKQHDPHLKLPHLIEAAVEKQLAIIFKDIHLVEAALAADSIVLSLDDVVRELLRTAAVSIGELRPIQWANPANEDEQVIVWLTRGARPEARRRLGLRNTNT
jgi:hypothetical protein